MTARIRLGFTLGDYPRPSSGDAGLFDAVLAQAEAAERAGFDAVLVPDHLMQTPVVAPRNDPMLECYTTLGALAARTSKVQLGAFVGAAAYRNPGLLAKAVTTLDVISHGRAIFGIGAGWFEAEHETYGFEFGPVAERYERLSDVVRIVRAMFTEDEATVEGRQFSVHGALNYPRPLRPGGPPVLIGGSGPKRTLRLVAQYADICNLKGGPREVAQLLRILDDHCAAVGREPSEICRTAICMVSVRDTAAAAQEALPPPYRGQEPVGVIAGTPDDVIARLREHLATGLDGLVLSCPPQNRTGEHVELLGALAQEAFGQR